LMAAHDFDMLEQPELHLRAWSLGVNSDRRFLWNGVGIRVRRNFKTSLHEFYVFALKAGTHVTFTSESYMVTTNAEVVHIDAQQAIVATRGARFAIADNDACTFKLSSSNAAAPIVIPAADERGVFAAAAAAAAQPKTPPTEPMTQDPFPSVAEVAAAAAPAKKKRERTPEQRLRDLAYQRKRRERLRAERQRVDEEVNRAIVLSLQRNFDQAAHDAPEPMEVPDSDSE